MNKDDIIDKFKDLGKTEDELNHELQKKRTLNNNERLIENLGKWQESIGNIVDMVTQLNLVQ